MHTVANAIVTFQGTYGVIPKGVILGEKAKASQVKSIVMLCREFTEESFNSLGIASKFHF